LEEDPTFRLIMHWTILPVDRDSWNMGYYDVNRLERIVHPLLHQLIGPSTNAGGPEWQTTPNSTLGSFPG
jgi:hypothetical protein